MHLGNQDFIKLAGAISKRLAGDAQKYRRMASDSEPLLRCSEDYYLDVESDLSSHVYDRALNRMSFAAYGNNEIPEGGEKGSILESRIECEQPAQFTNPLGPCAQACINPLGFTCGPAPFYCEGQTRFVCDIFTCNPGLHGGNTCFQEFECAIRFRCTSFDDSGEDCAWSTTFTCSHSAYTP